MQNDRLVEKVNNPDVKAILKYRNHPRILETDGKLKSNSAFSSCNITLEGTLKETRNRLNHL